MIMWLFLTDRSLLPGIHTFDSASCYQYVMAGRQIFFDISSNEYRKIISLTVYFNNKYKNRICWAIYTLQNLQIIFRAKAQILIASRSIRNA